MPAHEHELDAAAVALDADLTRLRQGPTVNDAIAKIDVGSRRLVVAPDPSAAGKEWPRWSVSMWCRLDSGTYVPIHGASIRLKVSDLAAFARAVATMLREASRFTRKWATDDDAHLRAMAAARAEANATT